MSIHFPTGHEEQTDPLNAWHTKLHILYWDINSFSAFNKITFTATRDSKDTAKPENTTPGLTKAEIRIGDKGDSCVREFSFIPSSKEEAFVSFQFNTDGVVKKSGELRCRVTDDYDVVFEAQIHKDKPEQQSDDDKKAAGKELLEENRCVSLRFRSYSSDKDKAVIDAVTTLEQDDFFTDSTLLCARESSLDQPVCGSLTCINPEGEGKLKVFDNTILTRDALTIRNVCYITNPAVFKSTGRATYATECTKGVSKISGNYSGEFQKYVADEKCPGGRKLKCESYAYCD